MNICKMIRELPRSNHEDQTSPSRHDFFKLLESMRDAIDANSGLARLKSFRDCERSLHLPLKTLEHTFIIESSVTNCCASALYVGSALAPAPYQLALSGWNTTAVDIMVDEVSAMRRFGRDTYGASVNHLMADVRGMAFADSSFDLVTGISVDEHVPECDTGLMLSELVRVCRPGGTLTFTVRIAMPDSCAPGFYGFSTKTFVKEFKTLASACGSSKEFSELYSDLDDTPSADLGKESNCIYHTVGLSFVLPEASEKQKLVDLLLNLSNSTEFEPQDAKYEKIELPDAEPLLMPQDSSLAESLQSGTFEQDVDAFFRDYVREGDVVFDVGANVGYYSRILGNLVGEKGCVHAFEPAAKPYQCLVRNTLDTGIQIRRNRFALSSENGSREIFLGAGHNEALNSFGEPFGIGETQDGSYEHETVWMMTMDAYSDAYDIRKVTLAKIDVEGWEEQVVRGGVETLQKYRPVLLLEYCSPAACNAGSSCLQLSRLLVSLGYRLYRYLPEQKELESVDERRDAWSFANLVAVPEGRLNEVIARLKGGSLPNIDDSSSAIVNDKVQRLELENARLRNQVDIEKTDREVAALTSESNARMAYIETLHKQVESLKSQLNISEKDRAARLVVIEQQSEALKQFQSHSIVKFGTSMMSVVRKVRKH